MDYKPGLVAASISQGKETTTNPVLDQLFSKPKEKPHPQKGVNKSKKSEKKAKSLTKNKVGVKRKKEESVTEAATATTSPTKKAKKESKESISPSRPSNPAAPSNDFPYVHEALLKQKTKPQESAKTKNRKKKAKKQVDVDDEPERLPGKQKRDKTADKRTVFVGNCPLSVDKKGIFKLFKDFGAIESIRFRCGPAAAPDLPRRAVIIKKEFHENAKSYVSYVVFKKLESAEAALKRNGHEVDGLHLRVDLASNSKRHDKKHTIFVGNLPFDVSEEALRSHFLDCGDINNVRIVRDRQTSIGKGIAYIQFKIKDGVMLAKKLNGKTFKGRELRVFTCTNKPVKTSAVQRLRKKKISIKPVAVPEKKRLGFAPSNRTSQSFHELLQAKKEKRVKKSNKLKQALKSKKSDGLSAIFGDMSADVKRLKGDNPKLRDKKTKDKKDKKNKKDKKMFKKGKNMKA